LAAPSCVFEDIFWRGFVLSNDSRSDSNGLDFADCNDFLRTNSLLLQAYFKFKAGFWPALGAWQGCLGTDSNGDSTIGVSFWWLHLAYSKTCFGVGCQLAMTRPLESDLEALDTAAMISCGHSHKPISSPTTVSDLR